MSTSSGTALDGRYLVEERLAEGGHSVVYRGRDLRLDAAVAIKVLKDQADVDAFRREARLAHQFEHPHAVRVLDFGPAPGDRVTAPYLVMEYVQGETLKTLARRLTGGQIRRFVSEIGGVLSFAHRRGLAHRDFKPQNVLLESARPGRSERFVLIDFGIAAKFDGTRSLQNHDADGLGTAPYMSPEQWRGTGDHRADIYAFGCVLFELLAETVPFPAEGFHGGLEGYIDHVSTSPAPRLRAAAPLCPVNDTIERLLASCLGKSPPDRPSDLGPIIAQFLAEFDPTAFDRYRESRLRVLGGTPQESLESQTTRSPITPGPVSASSDGRSNGEAPDADLRFHCQTVVVPPTSDDGDTAPVPEGCNDAAEPARAGSPVDGGREQGRDTHNVGGNTVKSGSGSVKPGAGRAPASPAATGRDLPAVPPAEFAAPAAVNPAFPSAVGVPDEASGSRKKASHGAAPVAWNVPLVGGSTTRSDPALSPPPRRMESGTAVPAAVTRPGGAQSVSSNRTAGATQHRAARVTPLTSRRRVPWLELAVAGFALIATVGLVLFHQSTDRQVQSIRTAIHSSEFSRAVDRWEAIAPSVAWMVDREGLRRDLADGIGERWKTLLARPAWNDLTRTQLSELRALLRRVDPGFDTEKSLVSAARERIAMIAKAVSEREYAHAEELLAGEDWSWLRTELGSAFPDEGWTHTRVFSDWIGQIERLDRPAQAQPLEEVRNRLDAALKALPEEPGATDERGTLEALRQRVMTAAAQPRA